MKTPLLRLSALAALLLAPTTAPAGWNDAANEFGALVDLKVRAVCERMELRSILKALPQEEAVREPEAVQGDLFAGL